MFYTNVQSLGNYIALRGINERGESIKRKIDPISGDTDHSQYGFTGAGTNFKTFCPEESCKFHLARWEGPGSWCLV